MVPGPAGRALGSKGLAALELCVILDETKCFSTDAAVSAHVFSLSQVDESFIHEAIKA